ncbi:hypothetical protein CC78DRAFT_609971 [Lojkania enalia]|uniref:Uncharacterized protein n=1 Tax=Lojkania enalia TaxID=147567 RepID=A0A9P4K230_9PLEO|nr:hypothetical protein CC78DRAFT_609971 [Didymosphaeria enalia]
MGNLGGQGEWGNSDPAIVTNIHLCARCASLDLNNMLNRSLEVARNDGWGDFMTIAKILFFFRQGRENKLGITKGTAKDMKDLYDEGNMRDVILEDLSNDEFVENVGDSQRDTSTEPSEGEGAYDNYDEQLTNSDNRTFETISAENTINNEDSAESIAGGGRPQMHYTGRVSAEQRGFVYYH